MKTAGQLFTSYLRSDEAIHCLADSWYTNVFLPFEVLLQACCVWSIKLEITLRSRQECLIQLFDKSTANLEYLDLLSLDYNELPRNFAKLIDYCGIYKESLFQTISEQSVLCSALYTDKTYKVSNPRFAFEIPRARLLLACLERQLCSTVSIEKTYEALSKVTLDVRASKLADLMKQICENLSTMSDMSFDERRRLLHDEHHATATAIDNQSHVTLKLTTTTTASIPVRRAKDLDVASHFKFVNLKQASRCQKMDGRT